MGQNKLENQIKEQLNSREIQPSAQAWDRLDAMLSVNEEKKTRRSFGWLYIAASVTVLLLAGMFFFSQESTKIDNQNTVVGTESEKDSVKKEQNQFQAPIVERNQENQVAVSSQTQSQKSTSTNNNKGVSITNQNQKSQNNHPSINRDKPIEFQNSSDVALKTLPQIETRKEIIVNRPNVANSKTDEELLAGLDNVGKKSTNKTTTLKIDPKSLLSQVDGELDMTFREKVISKVSKNYKEVKVALANRNNE